MNKKSDFWGKLKSLDAYPKINEDFFTKTMSGGIITIVSSLVMAILFLSELRLYFLIDTVHELAVDTSRGEKIKINMDIKLPHYPCSWLSIDAMDISGDMHLDVEHEIYKQRLSASGHPILQAERHDVDATKKTPAAAADHNGTDSKCGSCYGAEDHAGQCCNTCDEVRALYRKRGWAILSVTNIAQCADDHYLASLKEQQGEGCHVWGTLEVNKVAGNFHLAPGKSYQQGSMHVHDLAPFMGMQMDFSHTINSLSFGRAFPGMSNPLDAVTVKQPKVNDKEFHSGMYQYFLKVVPTEFTPLNGTSITTNQFSVTENFRAADTSGGRNLPGLFFFYDLSPIRVTMKQQKSEFLHFVTNVCAILGGVFTVAGIIDAAIYHSEKVIRKKMELGKFN